MHARFVSLTTLYAYDGGFCVKMRQVIISSSTVNQLGFCDKMWQVIISSSTVNQIGFCDKMRQVISSSIVNQLPKEELRDNEVSTTVYCFTAVRLVS